MWNHLSHITLAKTEGICSHPAARVRAKGPPHPYTCGGWWVLSSPSWAAITKCHRVRSLNNSNLLSQSCGVWEVWDQGAGQFCSGWEPSSRLADGHLLAASSRGRDSFSYSSHPLSPRLPLLIRASIPSDQGAFCDLITSQRPCLPVPSPGALGLQHMNLRGLGGGQTFSP